MNNIIDTIIANIPSANPNVDTQLLRFAAMSLSKEEAECTLSAIDKEDKSRPYAYSTARDELIKRLDYFSYKTREQEKVYQRNEPVKVLLERFNNKKSGMVADARMKLQKRFLYMPYQEQLLIMKTFIKGCKTDREWCYNTLRNWWTEEMEAFVLEAWNTYHEERCGWLFPRYMPMDVLQEHVEELSYDSNYYQLCRRLASEPWFYVDKEKLAALTNGLQYMWIMSMTENGLSSDESLKLIYRWIAVAIHYFDREADPDDSHFLDGRKTDFIVELNTWNINDNFYMHNLKTMDYMLANMCKMGLLEEVRQFLILDQKAHDDFISENKKDIEFIETQKSREQERILLESLYVRYARYFATCFPDKYKDLLNYWKSYAGNSCESHGERKPLREYYRLFEPEENEHEAEDKVSGMPGSAGMSEAVLPDTTDDLPF